LAGIFLVGFAEGDGREAAAALERLGRAPLGGGPSAPPAGGAGAAFVLAAAYGSEELRSLRAAALDDDRPWAFCVPASDRSLVAMAASAREGRLLLLPVDERELRRVLSALGQDARERSSGAAAFSGLERLSAAFSWRGADLDVSRVARAVARILAESGFYPDRAGEDDCALALEEALVNAVEHGNLGLDSSLKPADPGDPDRFEEERQRRLEDPELGGRPIRLELAVVGGRAEVSVEDSGEGFDPSILERPDSAGLAASGKGYCLIRRPFDSVSHNAKGNRITLAKRKPR